MKTTIDSQSGHTLFVQPFKPGIDTHPGDNYSLIRDRYSKMWVIKNWDQTGVPMLYVGRHTDSGQYHVWFKRGGFWSGYGTTIEKAINGAQVAGWIYA